MELDEEHVEWRRKNMEQKRKGSADSQRIGSVEKL